VPPVLLLGKRRGNDIGLEATVLHNRLTIEADYYIKKTQQAIFDAPVTVLPGSYTNSIIATRPIFRTKASSWRLYLER